MSGSQEADWFLIAARESKGESSLAGNVDFLLHDMQLGGMEMVEKYHTPGLLMMQYGRNKINIDVPQHRKMNFPPGKSNPLLMDIFNTARLTFPAMGLGFLTRIYEEATQYTGARQINRRPLDTYDLAKFRLEHLKLWKDLCVVLFEHKKINIDIYKSVANQTLLADTYKVIISDLILESYYPKGKAAH